MRKFASAACAALIGVGVLASTASPRLAAAAPRPGTAAGPGAVSGPAAMRGPALGPRAVFLINGEHVVARSGAGAGATLLLPGGRGTGTPAGSFMGFSLAGKSYLVPPQAAPYLGRGLNPNLFDVTALAGHERAGRLPVTVTYRGGVPRLPGVTLTHVASGAAQGYLTRAGAAVFGAALARQFAADRARGSYGQDGMFAAGLSVALAGDGMPALATPSQRRSPMHTLTVTATDLAGRPDTGDIVDVINVDNIRRFSDPVESQNVFYHGSARFSVPAGHYMAIATFYSGKRLTNWHVVTRPQFAVAGPATTVHLDARTATSKLHWVTPRPVTRPSVTVVNFERIPAVGYAFTFSYVLYGNALWVRPVHGTRLTGALHTVTDAHLVSPPHYRGTPYEYDLAYSAPDGAIPPLRYVVRPAALATEDARFYQSAASAGGWQAAGFFRFQFRRGGSSMEEIGTKVGLPRREIQYYATGRSLLWFDAYYQSIWSGTLGPADSGRVLHPGQHLSVDWNASPLHPAPNTNLLGASNPTPRILGVGGLTLPSASRAGNRLTLEITPFSDSTVGHTGSGFTAVSPGKVHGRYAVFAGGDRLAGGNAVQAAHGHADLRTAVRVPSGSQRIRFVLAASRTGRLYRLSPASRTIWTWRSEPARGLTLPPGWTCGSRTRSCAVQPMMTLEYAVAGESLHGSTRAGPQTVHLSVGHLQLVKGVRVTRASLSVSFDGGRIWHRARLTGHGGSYTAIFTAPEGVRVSLRASAADAAGGSITETLPGAYRVSP